MQAHTTATESATHASKPFFGSKSVSAKPFFSPSRVIQPKLTMGSPGDRFEREADAVADNVVQRMVSRNSGESVQQGITQQSGGGQSLDASLRREMEQDIGADFSGVRIHTSDSSAALNDMVHARAFTYGQDVFFNAGEFQPHSSTGRHLLAHELTHVVQQSGEPMLQRQEESGFHRFGDPPVPVGTRDDSGGGSTEFLDTVPEPTQTSGTGVISGEVRRLEIAPAGDAGAREVIHRGRMNVAFDPSTCAVTIPFGYRFVQADPADASGCDAGPAPRRLSRASFNRLKRNVLRLVNSGLNGWFDVQLSGSGCPSGCAGRALPIRVVATENNSSPDRTVTVVNRPGRSNSMTICAGSWSDSTAVHEGGHQVFGTGDEYPETEQDPETAGTETSRPERVRRDYSAMGPEQDSRFAIFHERHFNAVKVFLEHIFPNCTATLVEHSRPPVPDFRINFGTGFAGVSGLPGFFFRMGFDAGIPLDRMRSWEVTMGPEFTTLLGLGDDRLQGAFLAGVRFGLEGNSSDARFGVSGGPFLSAGYGHFFSQAPTGLGGDRSADAGYGEVGARFGLRTELDSYRYNFNLEGAAGSALGGPGLIGPTGPDIASDPLYTRWFRVGLGLTIEH
jgi:hypothetical protein